MRGLCRPGSAGQGQRKKPAPSTSRKDRKVSRLGSGREGRDKRGPRGGGSTSTRRWGLGKPHAPPRSCGSASPRRPDGRGLLLFEFAFCILHFAIWNEVN